MIDSDDLTIGGRLFQILRAATLKTRDAVTNLVLGMTRRSVLAEHINSVEMCRA